MVEGSINTAAGVPAAERVLLSSPAGPASLPDVAVLRRALDDICTDALITTDASGLIRSWNPSATRIYGYSQADAFQRPLTTIVPHERRTGMQTLFRKVMSGESIVSLDAIHLTRAGQTVDVRVSMAALREADSDPTGVLVIVRDVSEKNRILAEADELRQIVDGLPVLLCYVNTSEAIRFMNRPQEARLGLPCHEWNGMHLREAFGERYYALAQAKLHAAFRGQPSAFEFAYAIKTDERGTYQVIVQPDFDAFGVVRGAVLAATDISPLKLNEAQLRESELRFRLIAEGSPFGIFKTDRHGRIEYVNTQWSKMMGLGIENSDTESWMDSVSKDDLPELRRQWNECIEARSRLTLEFRLAEIHSGDWMELCVQPLFSDYGASFLGIIQDISSRKAVQERTAEHARALELANQSLEAQRRELESTNQALEQAKSAAIAATLAKSQFLANMSHEIRTPMTAILGFTDVLLDSDTSPAEFNEAVQTIRRNGQHLLQVINDILDVSRIEAGGMSVERVSCSPVDMVQEVVESMRVRANARGLAFRFVVTPPIPTRIVTDPTRLRQILLNLIGNAIKFTDEGQVIVGVESVPNDPGNIVFEVTDSGIGMSEDQLVRLFQPFSQADSSTTRRYGGTGLGLSISRRLAQMLGGDIVVKSALGCGSTFRLTIPMGSEGEAAVPSASTTSPASEPAVRAPGARPSLVHCRVLYAEDGPDNQRLVSHVLRKAGATVMVVPNGELAVEEALAANAAGMKYDIILMDMQMPVLDGYAATRLLRDKGYTGPIVALTAHAMSTDRERCFEAGCDGYAAKPISRDELIGVVADRFKPDAPGSQDLNWNI